MTATPAEIARRALADHLVAQPPTELLQRYATRRDPKAFAGLVQQFGPMVLGVCRRVLGPSADVDDAFQATFLALARQADSFRDAAALPAWLHRVALRVSHKALARRAPASAQPESVPDPADPYADVAWKDVRRVLDEELDALPEKYRGPVVLCWLDGLTQDEAAGKLGVSVATLKRRIGAGRELLRARLVRRGLAPLVAAAAVADPTSLRAIVPEVMKALAVELGVGGVVPGGVASLEVLVSATAPTRRAALAALLAAGTAAAGGIVYAVNRTRRPPEPERAERPATVGPDPGPRPVPARPNTRLVPRTRMTAYGRGGELWWSANGQRLAAITTDVKWENERVTVWNAETLAVQATLGTGARAGGIRTLAFDPSGTAVAVAHDDGTIRFWNVATGKETDQLPKYGGAVSSLAWSPDGAVLAFQAGRALVAWDVRAGKPRGAPTELAGTVTALAFAPDATALAALVSARVKDRDEYNVALVVWEIGTGRAHVRHEFASVHGTSTSRQPAFFGVFPNARYHAVTWSADGRFVTAACPDAGAQELVVIDAGTGKVHEHHRTAVLRSEDDLSGLTHISPDGRILTRGVWTQQSPDGNRRFARLSFKLLDARTGAERATIAAVGGFVTAARFSPDGKTLAYACRAYTGHQGEIETDRRVEIRLFDVETGKNRYATFTVPTADPGTPQRHLGRGEWTPNGIVVELASLAGGNYLFWNPITGEQATPISAQSRGVVFPWFPSPDGRFEAAQCVRRDPGYWGDRLIDVWDLASNRLHVTLRGREKASSDPKWSRDGRVLAMFEEGAILVWDVETGKLRAKLPAAVDSTTVWDLRPDGKTVIASHTFVLKGNGQSGYHAPLVTPVTLWEVDTGKRQVLPIQAVGLVYSPDGKYIAYTDEKDAVRVWDVAAGREYAKLDAPACYHNDPYRGALKPVFSPDGSVLAFVSRVEGGNVQKGPIQLWDVASKRTREPLTGHFDVTGIAWSPDGTTLASFNWYEVMLWDVSRGQEK